jgi:ATP/maltotriose-dependent transcriptional regulator MalT
MAAEAVAIGGTRERAAEWSAWFDAVWPGHVLRAPAWPVLVHRVRGLLASRTGDAMAALRWLEEAVVLADEIESPVESAIARVQYAELLTVDPPPNARQRWTELLRVGTEQCRALGIPPEHHAYRARIAATLGRFDVMPCAVAPDLPDSGLTPREVEVIRLFRDGLSYREAAGVLGVGWRTVQSHAYNAYQKLGVSSRIAAVTEAARLQLI